MEELDYRERLARDVPRWRREGIIDAAQEAQILARYGAGERRAVEAIRLGWVVSVVSIVGALVLGGGVVLLFATNWEDLPDWFRTAAVFAGIVAAYGAGYALIYRYDMQRIGSALLLLGVLLYQAGLFLVAQIYNMPVESPELFLLASIGALPVAYLFGSRIVLLIAISWSVAWVVLELMQRYEDAKFFASLLIIGVFGVILYAIGRLHTARETLMRFGEVYLLAGTLVTLSLVYLFTFSDLWQEIIDEGLESYSAPPLAYVSIGVAAALVGVAVWARRDDPEAHEGFIEAAALGAILLVATIVATWPAWTGYAIVFDVIYFGAGIGFVAHGYLRSDERYINFGLFVIAVGVITRYVDALWSLLDSEAGAAFFFMVGGALLLLLAFGIERFRRGLIQSMRNGGSNAPSGGRPAPEATL
jgi:uncharacterized membrane protein